MTPANPSQPTVAGDGAKATISRSEIAAATSSPTEAAVALPKAVRNSTSESSTQNGVRKSTMRVGSSHAKPASPMAHAR